jgi:transcriptional repressor NrdR
MTCPFCGHRQDRVIDSRESREGEVIRRRRECLKCERRFTTYERSDEIPYMVIKRDGRRERFDREKVLNGLLRACEKRPVPMYKLAETVDEVESRLADTPEREISTRVVGEVVLKRLKALDKIAYIRFASVYKDFQDVEAFLTELQDLLRDK